MHGEKSIARCKDLITASSSSSDADDHESLGVDLEQASEAHASTHNVGSSSAMPQHRGGSLYNEIHLPASTRPNDRTTFQCKFVLFS